MPLPQGYLASTACTRIHTGNGSHLFDFIVMSGHAGLCPFPRIISPLLALCKACFLLLHLLSLAYSTVWPQPFCDTIRWTYHFYSLHGLIPPHPPCLIVRCTSVTTWACSLGCAPPPQWAPAPPAGIASRAKGKEPTAVF